MDIFLFLRACFVTPIPNSTSDSNSAFFRLTDDDDDKISKAEESGNRQNNTRILLGGRHRHCCKKQTFFHSFCFDTISICLFFPDIPSVSQTKRAKTTFATVVWVGNPKRIPFPLHFLFSLLLVFYTFYPIIGTKSLFPSTARKMNCSRASNWNTVSFSTLKKS